MADDTLPQLQTNYAQSSGEALARATLYRDTDPFEDIPTALLSSEHIRAYVKQTGMVHPFYDTPQRLKSASYEINPGGFFIYWDQQGRKVTQVLESGSIFTLPANSISFVQLESEFYLPNYIAIRFNLRITHVHRGLLLGTGPLVDPGFQGKILIPLHNLTLEEYTIRADEGLVWMEFTKTSHQGPRLHLDHAEKFDTIEARKNDQPPEYYFDKANKNRPIQSSIPSVVAEALARARAAERAARRAERSNRIFVGVGLFAVAATAIGLLQYVEASKGNSIAAYNLAASIGTTATQAASDAKNAHDELSEILTRLNTENHRSAEQIQSLQSQLNDARARLDALEADSQHLAEQFKLLLATQRVHQQRR